MDQDAFFLPDRDPGAFRATPLARGPWDATLQHGGPPAALLARAVEAVAADGPVQVARLTVDLLRPVPIGPVRVDTEVVRTGRGAQVVQALLHAGGKLALRATALRIRTDQVALDPAPAPPPPALPPPAACPTFTFPFFVADVGYHTALECRAARGTFGRGAMALWMRLRPGLALVEGEAPSPLQRVVVAADSGNGVSLALDPSRYTFVNPDLTVHLHRLPEGEWVGLDATTVPWPSGVGLAESALHDERGPLGRSLQSLVVARRELQRP